MPIDDEQDDDAQGSQDDDRRRFRAGLVLAQLPYSKALYRAGGWLRSAGPGALDWKVFLSEYFPRPVLAAAFRRADEQLKELRAGKIDFRVVSIWDPEYPDSLRSIFDPPPVLFVRGPLPPPARPLIAVVGTRNPMPFTADVTAALMAALKGGAFAGMFASMFDDDPAHASDELPVIVSGFARGVDRQAHQAAIRAGLPTLAVLGMGVDRPGPVRNRDLPAEARRRGVPFTFLSEFPPGTPGYPAHFPRRNRIIAGLAGLTILIQAPRKSGAMITARFALEEGRDVAVFDHELFDEGANGGCRDLLEAGAELLRFPGWEGGIVREPPFPREGSRGDDPALLAFWRERAAGGLRRIGPGVYWRPTGSD